MRLSLIGLTAAGLLVSQAANAIVPYCLHPAEQSALDVEGLKSELMVTALACGTKAEYNAFVTRFKPDLNKEEKQINAFFNHAYGRQGRKQQDEYITQLANGQSQDGTKQGTLFCQQHVPMFNQVMALRNGSELPEYAAGQALMQPATAQACSTATPVMQVAARARIVHHPVTRRRVVHHPVKHHR